MNLHQEMLEKIRKENEYLFKGHSDIRKEVSQKTITFLKVYGELETYTEEKLYEKVKDTYKTIDEYVIKDIVKMLRVTYNDIVRKKELKENTEMLKRIEEHKKNCFTV